MTLYSVVYEDGTRSFHPTKAVAREAFRRAYDAFNRAVEAQAPSVEPTGVDRHEFPRSGRKVLLRLLNDSVYGPADATHFVLKESRTSIVPFVG